MSFLDTLMTRLDASGLAFVVIVCVLLPLAAIRSARRAPAEVREVRMSQRLRTVAVLIGLAAVAMLVADRNDIPLFPPHRHATSHVTLGAAVLLAPRPLLAGRAKSSTAARLSRGWEGRRRPCRDTSPRRPG